MKKIAVVGHGYVGKAVEYGFNTKKNKISLSDPALYGNSVDRMEDADVTFSKTGKILRADLFFLIVSSEIFVSFDNLLSEKPIDLT